MEISNEHQCGLFCTDESKPSPLLEGVIVQAKLNTNRTCQVHLCQSYLNPTEEAVEVIYIFPLDHRSAVCAFEATIDGVVIQGKVLPTEKAEATYQQAKKEGRKTSLLTQKKQEIFQLNVGNLPAGARATIQLTYVSELLHSADASTQQKGMIHFYLPTHVAPRYCPSSCSSPLPWWTHVPASLLELFSNSRSSSALSCDPSPLSIFVNIDSLAPLREITSNSHAISVEKFPSPAGSSAPHQAEVTLKSNSPLDRDFLLDIAIDQPHQPVATLEVNPTDPTSAVASLCFVPEFNLKNDPSHLNFVFVVDRSGSMASDSKLPATRQTLELFLKALPVGCHFNIVGFGSEFEFLFPEAVPYNNESLVKAVTHAQTLQANLGGTEILRPLEAIFQRDGGKGDRQIFILTDGEVGNTESVIGCVAQHCAGCNDRVFTIGLGPDVSHQLVDGVAHAGKGTSVYATGQTDQKLSLEVKRQLKQALQPYLRNVKISWPQPTEESDVKTNKEDVSEAKSTPNVTGSLMGHVSEEATGLPVIKELPPVPIPLVRQVPFTTPSLHSGSQFLAYAMLHGQMPCPLPSFITVTADTPGDGPLSLTVPLLHTRDTLLHVLAARRRIKELEECTSEHEFGPYRTTSDSVAQTRQEIENLAMKWGLMSRCTSYVAYEGSTITLEPTSEDQIRKVSVMGIFSSSSSVKGPQGCVGVAGSPGSQGPRGYQLQCAFGGMSDDDMDEECDELEDGDVDDDAYVSPTSSEWVAAGVSSTPEKAPDPLMMILGCINATGQFEWHPSLDDLVPDLALVVKTGDPNFPICSAMDLLLWANAVIIAYCQNRFGDRQDEWELIFDKVKNWITSQISATQSTVTLTELITRASSQLSLISSQ